MMKSVYDFCIIWQGAQKLVVAENCTILFLSEYHKQTKIYEQPFVQTTNLGLDQDIKISSEK